MKDVAVWGSSTIVAPIIDVLSNLRLVECLNDNIPCGQVEGKFKQWPVTGTSDKIKHLLCANNMHFVLTAMTMKNKRAVWNKMMSFDIPLDRFVNVIHPSAVFYEEYCYIGTGVVMAPLVQLSPGAVIGDNCILYANSFVGHDSILGRCVVVANNASIGGYINIERGVHIGSNASIRERITIGEFSVIGMGSVVLNDVPPNTIVAGNPAQKIGETE